MTFSCFLGATFQGILLFIGEIPMLARILLYYSRNSRYLSYQTGFRSGGGEDQSDEGTAQEVIRKVIAMTRERHSKEERASGQADRKDSEEIGPGPIDPGKKRPTFSFWGGGWFVGPIHRLPLRSTVVFH